MNIQTEDGHVWKAKCEGSAGASPAGRRSRTVSDSCPASRGHSRRERPRSPESTCWSSDERAVPAQEFRGAHSPFSFKLHFGERKCAFASGNDQVFVAAQNFSGLAIEVDN